MSTNRRHPSLPRRRLLAAGLATGVGVALLVRAASAAPAPWYYWRSKLDGRRVCAQTSPGEGWQRDSDAYPKPMCKGQPRPPGAPPQR